MEGTVGTGTITESEFCFKLSVAPETARAILDWPEIVRYDPRQPHYLKGTENHWGLMNVVAVNVVRGRDESIAFWLRSIGF